MDIQISSNFERLLFEAYGRDGEAVRRLMASLNQSRAFAIDAEPLARIREEFTATAVNEDNVVAEMAETYRSTGYVLDPHSAVGTRAGRALLEGRSATRPSSPSPPPIRRNSRMRSSARQASAPPFRRTWRI